MGKRKRFLSHPHDVHCVIYHLLTLAGYGCAFWIYLHPEQAGIEGPAELTAFVLAAALMLGWASGIDVGLNFHNHSHMPIFGWKWLNRWFARLWTFSGGWPSHFWVHAHVRVHHPRTLHPEDWTLPVKLPDGSFESYHSYALKHWPWRYAKHLWRELIVEPKQRKKALIELAIFLALWSVPFIIDPLMGLVLWLFPQWIGNVSFMAPGMYLQHIDCVPKSREHPLNHSNTFLSWFMNLTMFNIGYHTEHHDYPRVHWSELPELHERIKPKLLESKTRVLDIGYYRAAVVFAFWRDREKIREEFESWTHPDFRQ